MTLFLPPARPDPHSKSERELVYATLDWWEVVVLITQSSSFPSGPSPNFSCCIPAAGTISQVGKFAMIPSLNKSATPSDLKALSLESVKAAFPVSHKAVDTASVQNLLFLSDVAEVFQQHPLHDPQGDLSILPSAPHWCSVSSPATAGGCIGHIILHTS